MTSHPDSASPSLLKARIRHTRWAALPLLALLLTARPLWTRPLVLGAADWLGYAALIVCVLGRAWCAAYIGGRKTHELITIGPFSVVRNPLYVFSFIGVLGIGLISGMIVVTALLAALFALYYREVVRREEAVLGERFGAVYEDYRRRVPRWWPRPDLWRDEAEIMVKPAMLWATMRDAAWFFVAFPALEAIDHLQRADILPVLIGLP